MSSSIKFPKPCKVCEKVFTVATDNDEQLEDRAVLKSDEYMINGKVYMLTWYDCPFCGHRHFVQVDDEKTREKLSRLTSVFLTMGKGKKKSALIKKIQTDLAESRSLLEERVSGKHVHDSQLDLDFEVVIVHD